MKILLFVGPSGSGKSTIATSLAEENGFEVLRERAIVRKLANERGFTRSREWLASEDIKGFLEAALAETEVQISNIVNGYKLRPLGLDKLAVIVDGVYDAHVVSMVKNFYGSENTKTVMVDAPAETRIARSARRINGSMDEAKKEMNFLDRFKFEAGAYEIYRNADFTIENTGTINEAKNEIRKHVLKNNIEGGNFGKERAG